MNMFRGGIQVLRSEEKLQAPVAIGAHLVLPSRGSLSGGQRGCPQSELRIDRSSLGHFRRGGPLPLLGNSGCVGKLGGKRELSSFKNQPA